MSEVEDAGQSAATLGGRPEVLPSIDSPGRKARFDHDALGGDSPREVKGGGKHRSSIGTTKLNERKAQRALAEAQRRQQQLAAQPKPLSRGQVEEKMRELLAYEHPLLPGQALGGSLVPHPPASPGANTVTTNAERPKTRVQSANQASRAFLQSVLRGASPKGAARRHPRPIQPLHAWAGWLSRLARGLTRTPRRTTNAL